MLPGQSEGGGFGGGLWGVGVWGCNALRLQVLGGLEIPLGFKV